jgi:assimilatory nitrate reductase catalytic subunit
MKEILAQHGPHSVAFLTTGQIPTEEMAFLGCLAKFGMGLLHGDANTRQCMATSAVAYKQSFGFDAPGFCYEDLEESDCLLFVGANPCIAHPILWQHVQRNRHSPEIMVIDPRVTETAMAATEHLAIQPKGDLALLYGLARQLIGMGAVDQHFIDEHTLGFEAYREHVQPYTFERVREYSGIGIEQQKRVAEKLARARRASFWWTMGVNQSHQGVRTAQALINLALLTGNIGRPGTGPNSITGQCNAMGSRLFSNTSSLIGHRDFANPQDRIDVARILGIPVDRIPQEASLAYDQILDGVERGTIRGLWIVATNPAHSWIDAGRARRLLEKLDFLVVQDMYFTTETARLADLVLPAAGWGEKEGTFINSERRIGTIKRVRKAPGKALTDFSIFRLIATAWGCDKEFDQWTSPQAVFEILKRLSQDRACDITGIRDHAFVDECGGIQWPYTSAMAQRQSQPPKNSRLFTDGIFFHPDGRARFLFEEIVSLPEPVCKLYPYILLTGRSSVSQWHTQSRTSKSPLLRDLSPKHPYVEVHPSDAEKERLRAGQWIVVRSRRGQARAQVFVTATVQQGHLFMPMHDVQTNQLTLQHVDPWSRQPAYKDCAVQIIRE